MRLIKMMVQKGWGEGGESVMMRTIITVKIKIKIRMVIIMAITTMVTIMITTVMMDTITKVMLVIMITLMIIKYVYNCRRKPVILTRSSIQILLFLKAIIS